MIAQCFAKTIREVLKLLRQWYYMLRTKYIGMCFFSMTLLTLTSDIQNLQKPTVAVFLTLHFFNVQQDLVEHGPRYSTVLN